MQHTETADSAPRSNLARIDPALLWRGAPEETWQVTVHGPGAAGREPVEAFLEAAYDRAFDGRIRRHYPFLMSVRDRQGAVQAAVGYRPGGPGPMFLEQYLDVPIETALIEKFGPVSGRAAVVEIGNLASRSAGASLFLFLTLARRLHARGCTHAVATATRQLRRLFKRIGFETQPLVRAEPVRLVGGAADWGAYYRRDPEVRAGLIAQALPVLERLIPPPAAPLLTLVPGIAL